LRGADVKVIQRHYDLMLWYFQRVEKFPRSQRFVVGDRIEVLLLDVLDALIEARYSADPTPPLRRANLLLERLRYLTRLAMDLQLLTRRQYAFAAEGLDDVGRQVGGWLKASEPKE
jgi:hypothetical protein